MDMSQKGGAPGTGKGAAEKVEMCRVQGRESRHRKLQ